MFFFPFRDRVETCGKGLIQQKYPPYCQGLETFMSPFLRWFAVYTHPNFSGGDSNMMMFLEAPCVFFVMFKG